MERTEKEEKPFMVKVPKPIIEMSEEELEEFTEEVLTRLLGRE